MQKIIKILFTVILSALIVSPVHAEESGTVEFTFSKEAVSHDSEQPVDGKSVTVNIENTNANIQYINSKSLIVPTGISLPVGGALFIIVGIGIILIAKKHKQVV